MRPPHKLVHRLGAQRIAGLIADYRNDASVHDLVERYGISKTSVLALLHDHGVPVRTSRRLSSAEVEEAAALYRSGLSLVKIGQRMGVDDETIRGRLRRAGVQMRNCHERVHAQA